MHRVPAMQPNESIVVSISRTRDPLKENPDWLTAALRGQVPVRLSRGHPQQPLDPGALGAVVLWTKDPRALVEHAGLREALSALHGQGIAVVLQLTVTGLGGTPVEPGIPAWPEVRDSLARVLGQGVLPAAAVKLRYDPVVSLGDLLGHRWSNRDEGVLTRVLDAFAGLGVGRVTASLAQIDEYPRVARRLVRLGLTHDPGAPGEGRAFLVSAAALCAERGLAYSTCVFPPDATSLHEGCIDGRWVNELLQRSGSPRRVTCTLHNARGRQRPDCRCTFSYDLGASTGIGHCFDARERWCAYCYSASATRGVTEPR